MTNHLVVDEVDAFDPLDRIVDDILGESEPEEVEAKPLADEEINEEETEEVESEDEPDYIELKHNGKPVKLKLDEVIEHAQKGFDYTQKTQELADQRKQVEQYAQFVQQQAEFQKQFQAETAQIGAIDMQLQRFKEVDWSAYTDQDPVEATKAWQRYQLMQQQRGEMVQTLTQRQAQAQREMAQRTDKALAEAASQLENELGKAWNAETRKALKDNASTYGFSDEELSQIVDPRVVKVLFDAYKYRQLQSQKVSVNKKVSEAPKLAKPGGKPVQVESSKRNQLTKMLKSSSSRSTRESAAMALLDDFVR